MSVCVGGFVCVPGVHVWGFEWVCVCTHPPTMGRCCVAQLRVRAASLGKYYFRRKILFTGRCSVVQQRVRAASSGRALPSWLLPPYLPPVPGSGVGGGGALGNSRGRATAVAGEGGGGGVAVAREGMFESKQYYSIIRNELFINNINIQLDSGVKSQNLSLLGVWENVFLIAMGI